MNQVLRYAVEISYKGTNYSGWQRQLNAVTIQQEIEDCIIKLYKHELSIVGCGRTDAGVHALQSYFHFDIDQEIIEEEFVFRLNKILSDDIVIHDIKKVHDDFHARFDAISRSYHYLIGFSKDPFRNELIWKYPYTNELNIENLNEAASILMNYDSFYPFCKSNTDVKTYQCTIEKILWHSQGDLLVFEITANRFLRGMIRLIVGMCINYTQGKLSLEELKFALDNQSRLERSYSAPAEGLYLKNIIYPKH